MQRGDAGNLRAWWKLEDLFAPDASEKAAIKFQTRLVDIQKVYRRDASATLLDKEVEVDANDVGRT